MSVGNVADGKQMEETDKQRNGETGPCEVSESEFATMVQENGAVGDNSCTMQVNSMADIEKLLQGSDGQPAQVIYVYQDVCSMVQDILTCGICEKQFSDVCEYIQHKIHHPLGNTTMHKCELCKALFTTADILTAHYCKFHQLVFHEWSQSEPTVQQSFNGEVTNGDSITNEGSTEDEQKHTATVSTDSADHAENDMEEAPEEGDQAKLCEEPGVVAMNGLPEPTVENAAPAVNETEQSDHITTETRDENPAEDSSTAVVSSSSSTTVTSASPRLVPSRRTSRVTGTKLTKTGTSAKSDFSFILLTEVMHGSSFTYGKTWFQCLHCEYKTASKPAITRHMHDKHSDMLALHENIEVKTNNQNEAKKVMRMSVYESICGTNNAVHRRNRRGRRIERQDMPGVFTCDKCGKVFSRLRYLRKHMDTHRTEKKHICDECGKSFKSRTYLSVHRKIHRDKQFQCNQCDFSSCINAAIHAHRQIHNQGSVLCDICGNAYSDRSTLNKHKRVHDANRPYACNYPGCTWRFKTEVMCRAHIRGHTEDVSKFKCVLCGYVFRHKHHLIRHQRNMHGLKPAKTSAPQRQIKEMALNIDETLKHLVVDATNSDMQFLENGISERHLVVTTDSDGAPIAFEQVEGTEISESLNVAYQTLLHGQEVTHDGTHTILLDPGEHTTIFKQEATEGAVIFTQE